MKNWIVSLQGLNKYFVPLCVQDSVVPLLFPFNQKSPKSYKIWPETNSRSMTLAMQRKYEGLETLLNFLFKYVKTSMVPHLLALAWRDCQQNKKMLMTVTWRRWEVILKRGVFLFIFLLTSLTNINKLIFNIDRLILLWNISFFVSDIFWLV